MEDELMSVERAAQYAGGLSKWTIHAWLSKRKLPRTKVGGRTMIRQSDLEAFIASCNPESPKPGSVDLSGDSVSRTTVEGVDRQIAPEKSRSEKGSKPSPAKHHPEAPDQQILFPEQATEEFDTCAASRPGPRSRTLSLTKKLSKNPPTGPKARERMAADQNSQVRGPEK
jgi:excisionase family DNA binding protein